MRVALPLVLVVLLALPASAPGKGFNRVVVIGSDGTWVDVRAVESRIDGLLSWRGAVEVPRGGYLRLFFVGPGDFPANPARYYPGPRCVALDWPTYETTCQRVGQILLRAHALPRFRVRPTVLTRIRLLGTLRGEPATADGLKSPVELALLRVGPRAVRPRRCYAFAGRWRGSLASLRPKRFLLCASGIYANGRLYPLGRGVWEWFALNAGPPEGVSRARSPR